MNKNTFDTHEDLRKAIKDDRLTIEGDLKVNFNINISADMIIRGNIFAKNISAKCIKAFDIKARDIRADNIMASNVSANNIQAENIIVAHMMANDIVASEISAFSINANDISFFGVCFAYFDFRCKSITGRRNNSRYFCLDSEVIIDK